MSSDHGQAADHLGLGVSLGLADLVQRATTIWRVDRFDADQTAWAHDRLGLSPLGLSLTVEDFADLGIRPYETTETVGNAVLQAGWARVLANLTAVPAATAVYDGTHARIGAGNGVTAVNATTDTDLSAAAGSANRWFQLV